MGKYILAFSVVFCVTGFSSIKTDGTNTQLSFTHTIDNITGTVTGTVIVPEQSTGRRQFRGSSYRSRGTSASPSTSDSNTEEDSKYRNTIISAHPLSFSVPDDMSGEPVIIGQKMLLSFLM